MIFYKSNKMSTVYSSDKNKKYTYDIAESMNDVLLNKTAEDQIKNNKSEELINNLNRSSELFEDVGNVKAAEIITKIIEKIAGK
jgi:hypothetical protein